MMPDIKLKRLCQKGPVAALVRRLAADWNESLGVLDLAGETLLGDAGGDSERYPIAWGGQPPIGWVCGGRYAPLAAELIAYAAQKELEGKLLAQETLGKYKELTLLYELGEKIAGCLDTGELVRLALGEARRLLPRDKGLQIAVLLAEKEGKSLTVAAGDGELFPPGLVLEPLDGITRQVLASGNAEILDDVREDPRYQAESGILAGMRAYLCAPLRANDRSFGILGIVSREPAAFSAAELKVLNLLAGQTAMALGRIDLIRARLEQERLQESLKLSRSIQMGMLRTDFPRAIDGGPVDMYALMEPAREVSGDFYDFFHLDPRTLLIVIGDVSDKGMPAALFMVMVKTLIRAIAKAHWEPHRILEALNPELCRDNDSAMFVTLFLATLDLESGRMAYGFGGHNPPLLLRRDGSVRFLEGDSGAALGIMEGMPYRTQSLVLEPGDGVLLYTDGVSEAMDTAQAVFGEDRLQRLLDGVADGDARALVESVMAGVREFAAGAEQSDDITLLALRFGASR